MARPRITGALMLTSLVIACSEVTPLPPLLVLDRGVSAIGDGEELILLDSESGVLPSQPTWAPDGTFAVWTEIAVDGSSGTIAMGNDESQRRIDGGTIPYFYGFSPDGESLAYLGNDPEGGGVALGVVDVATGSARLLDRGQPYYLDWTEDGSRLVVHANGSDLYLLDLEGNRSDLDVEAGVFQAPAFVGPDRLLMVAGETLALLDIDSQAITDIAPVSGFSAFSPSPDGQRLAYIDSPPDTPGALSVVSIEGGDSLRIEEDPVVMFDWSPDGSRLLYLVLGPEGLVPAVWNGEESVRYDLFLPTRTLFQSYLPFWDQYNRFLSLWRADGAGFFLPRSNGDATEIAFYALDRSEPEVIARGEMAVPAP